MVKNQYPYGALLFFVSIAIFSLCLIICSPAPCVKVGDRLYVVCTTGILADMVAAIGGEGVQVDSLMGPGVDPHLYRARESDMHKLAEADIILYHGLHLEGKMAAIFERIGTYKTVVAVSDVIPKKLLRASPDISEFYDPHVWHDVTLWQYAASSVGEVLMAQDQKNKDIYEKRSKQYTEQLRDLDCYIRMQVATIASQQRVLITAHDAFSYFGKAYGFEVIGLQGINTDSEISTHDIWRVVDIVVKRNIRALFVESLIPQRTIQVVRDAVQAHGKTIELGAELFSDALGDASSGAHTYIDMMKHNVDALVTALR